MSGVVRMCSTSDRDHWLHMSTPPCVQCSLHQTMRTHLRILADQLQQITQFCLAFVFFFHFSDAVPFTKTADVNMAFPHYSLVLLHLKLHCDTWKNFEESLVQIQTLGLNGSSIIVLLLKQEVANQFGCCRKMKRFECNLKQSDLKFMTWGGWSVPRSRPAAGDIDNNVAVVCK